MKNVVLLFLASLTSCANQEDNTKGATRRESANVYAQTRSEPIDSSLPPSPMSTATDSLVGVETIGPFRIFTTSVAEGEDYYVGNPKIEVFNENNIVINVIDVLASQELLPEDAYFEVSSLLGNNRFEVLSKKEDAMNSFGTDSPTYTLFDSANIILEITYNIEPSLLLIQYNFLALDGLKLYGAKTEVLVINSKGQEVGRCRVNGNLFSANTTQDNAMLYINTGGQINEDSRHPTGFYAYDLQEQKIIFEFRENSGQCIKGGVIDGSNRACLYILDDSSCSIRSIAELWILDHQSKHVYKGRDFNAINCSQGGFQIFDNRCSCVGGDGVRRIWYYDKDFVTERF